MFAFLQRLARRIGVLMHRREHERAMDEEMHFHVEMEAAELQRGGTPAIEARRRARIAFGGVDRFKEEGRDARGTRLVEDLWVDVRYALRQLRASRGFAAATVLTLALGIGAATMMYSFQRSLVSEGSALESPERLVFLEQLPKDCLRCGRMASGNYITIRDQAQSLEYVSLFLDWDPILRGPDHAELIDGVRVTTEFFLTLGIPPLLGRTLVPEDSATDRHQVAVLSERMWRDRFDGENDVLGRTMILDRLPYTIVGVVADAAMYPANTDFWTPLIFTARDANERGRAEYRAIGRLRDGATARMAATEIAAVGGRLSAEFPALMRNATLGVVPVVDFYALSGDTETWTFTAAVGLVLLISWINLAGLVIARLTARRRELAVRRTMGAAPGRIVRQLLVETILVTALGGALGAGFAAWGLRALIGWSQLQIDGNAFALALALGMLSGLGIGLWPALRFAKPHLVHELRAATRTATGGIDFARARRTLVIAEVALAIVLLSAAGLLARSIQEIYQVDPGFNTERVLTLRLQNPPVAPNAGPQPDRMDRLVQSIGAIAGVERAGAVLGMPYGVGAARGSFEIAGQPPLLPERRPRVRMQAATPGYFDALEIPIVRGRAFTNGDAANSPRVALINEVVAQRFFPDEDPIGRTLIIDSLRWEIVGVVGSVFYGDVEQIESPEIYRPMQQWPRPTVWIAARTRGDPAQIALQVTAAVRAFDPDIAITRLFTMNALRTDSMGSERMMLRLMGGFAFAAVLISAIGLYGLISYSVSQRTREFGVRLALGAGPSAVLGLVLGQGVRLAAVGAALGITGAIAALRVMQSMLFRVSPTDPLTLGIVVVLICAVALLAAYIPARRATLIDPMSSLRQE
jgi:predicted permease